MADQISPSQSLIRSRITRATKANQELARMLEATEWPTVTDYELFKKVKELYESDKKLNLRHQRASLNDYKRLRRQLRNLGVLQADPDYSTFAYRILTTSDRPADEICCLIDPFCYISHISAMQRYGLTQRRPNTLFLTTPSLQTGKQLIIRKMIRDHGENIGRHLDEIITLKLVHHPRMVRKRQITEFRTKYFGEWVQVRGSMARIATIGQTFADMMAEPSRCGGMSHVIDVWREHASTYREEIIQAIETARTAITKVRAGYILSELLSINDPRVIAWKRFAMRGGSRVLDPSKPYAPEFSETWMISTNV